MDYQKTYACLRPLRLFVSSFSLSRSIAAGIGKVFSCVCVCVCPFVRALKGVRLEPSTAKKLVAIWLTTIVEAYRYVLIARTEVKRSKSRVMVGIKDG